MGEVSYIHKVHDGHDCYFFANSSDSLVDTKVRLRGKITPRIMDPHTGIISDAQFQNATESGQDVTVVTLKINPIQSLFIRNEIPVAAQRSETGAQRPRESKTQ
jgi:hypothetical protein